MMGRMNRKKVIKTISLGLSVYMALIPIVVSAEELPDAEWPLAEQIEVSNEVSANVEQVVEETINLIENEAIKEATESIVNVDMSNVDDGLDKVTEIISNTLTDETIADQIEVTADALISIYDVQAETALNALKELSEEMEAVTILEDGSVNIDWNVATDEITELYGTYQTALASKEVAQTAKSEAVEKKTSMTDKINELNGGAISNNKEVSENISNSKQNKNTAINEIIASVAELHSKDIKNEYTLDEKVNGSSDIYRFYINIVEDGVAYGCLTYYDSESKIILRKNFKISSDNIDYDYVPKDEWVKGNANCKKVVFGNGGNYIAAYVNNTSGYIKGGKTFDGPNVSNLMRANVNLNSDIDARNQALNDLEEINQAIEKAEEDLQDASENADNALKAYKEAVAMYKKVAALDEEIKNSIVEKTKLEYVKAEVEVWRRQQVLEQIKNTINNDVADNKIDAVSDEEFENIENIINSIAANLEVEPEAVEKIVAQIIIDEENSYVAETYNSEDTAVLGVRKAKETNVIEKKEVEIEETEESVEKVMPIANETAVEEVNNTLNASQDVVIIEDEEVPLANFNVDLEYSKNWWLPLVIALACVTLIMYIEGKKKQKMN